MRDYGSIIITRNQNETVTIMVRSPGARTESEVTLPLDIWQRIAVPPELSVAVAGDWTQP